MYNPGTCIKFSTHQVKSSNGDMEDTPYYDINVDTSNMLLKTDTLIFNCGNAAGQPLT